MADSCIVCTTIHPDSEPRLPERPPVCESDRLRLANWLEEIVSHYIELCNPHTEPAAHPTVEYDTQGRRTEIRGPASFPAGPTPGQSNQPAVGGSRERTMPISADHFDLTSPAKPASIDIKYRGHWSQHSGGDPDQIGFLSTATELDFWVRDWRTALYPDHSLPAPVVATLASWLTARLDYACDQHPAIGEFATKIKTLRNVLRRAAGITEPQPEPIPGIPCKRCDLMTLTRPTNPDHVGECGNCGKLYKPGDFQDWITEIRAETKKP